MSGRIVRIEVTEFDALPRLSDAEKAYLDGLTDEDIACAAAEDIDNPILTEADLEEFGPVSDAGYVGLARQ